MADYVIKSPEGQEFRITAPDDASPDEVYSYFRQNNPDAKSAMSGIAQSARGLFAGVKDGALFSLDDEAQAAVDRVALGKEYGGALEAYRQNKAEAQENAPKSYLTGQILGSVATPLGIAKLAGRAIPAVAGRIAAYAASNPIRSTAAAGAVQGGLYGFGGGENGATERLEEAGKSAVVGGVAGGAGSYALGKLLGKADNALVNFAAKNAVDDGELPPFAPMSGKAENKVIARLADDLGPDRDSALAAYAQDNGKGLVESAGQRTTGLAETANLYPGATPKGVQYFGERVAGSPDRIKTAVTDIVSDKTNFLDTVDEITKRGQAKAAPKYKAAFEVGPVNSDRIQQFLAAPEMQSGISRGLKIQRLEATAAGEAFNPTDYAVTGFNEAGDPVLGQVPNMRLLDAGKRGLDAMIEENTDEFGKVNELGRALTQFKSGLLTEMDSINPAYKAARAEAGDYLSNREAARAGSNFLKEDREQIERLFKSYTPYQKQSYRAGVASALRNDIDRISDGRNVTRVFSNPNNRKKLTTILGQEDFSKLYAVAKAEDQMFKIRNSILGNSKTAQRQIAAQDFEQDGLDFIGDVARSGWASVALDRSLQLVKRVGSGISDKSAKEVADILYETDPVKKAEILKRLSTTAESKKQDVLTTEAGKKLQTYFAINDKVKQARLAQGGVAGTLAGPDTDLSLKQKEQ